MPRGRASSFHLFWRLPREARNARLVEVSAVLEIVVPPQDRSLYFWALQVDFVDRRGTWGGAHTGLQWNRRYPGHTAVNWGGYASAGGGSTVLPGSRSSLPGFDDDPNTLSYEWSTGRSYRLRVFRSPDTAGAWRAEVTDLQTGVATVIRDLSPTRAGRGGLLSRVLGRASGVDSDAGPNSGFLSRPLVWSEVFAECDEPSVEVRWTDMQAVDEGGRVLRPESVAVNYQAARDGGCSNTDSSPDGHGGVVQRTNTTRAVAQGQEIPLS